MKATSCLNVYSLRIQLTGCWLNILGEVSPQKKMLYVQCCDGDRICRFDSWLNAEAWNYQHLLFQPLRHFLQFSQFLHLLAFGHIVITSYAFHHMDSSAFISSHTFCLCFFFQWCKDPAPCSEKNGPRH